MSRALISLESSLFGFMLYSPLLRMDFQLSVHSMAVVFVLWQGAAVYHGIKQLKNIPKLKIYARNVFFLEGSLLTKIKVNFEAVFNNVKSFIFLLSMSMDLLKLIRSLGTSHCTAFGLIHVVNSASSFRSTQVLWGLSWESAASWGRPGASCLLILSL